MPGHSPGSYTTHILHTAKIGNVKGFMCVKKWKMADFQLSELIVKMKFCKFHYIVSTAKLELQVDLHKPWRYVTTIYSEITLSIVLFLKLYKLHSTIKSKMHSYYNRKRQIHNSFGPFQQLLLLFAKFSEHPLVGDNMSAKSW